MSYIKGKYGTQSNDFIKGFLAAMETYAVRVNEECFVGVPRKEIWGEMISAITDLGGSPGDFLDSEGMKIHRL